MGPKGRPDATGFSGAIPTPVSVAATVPSRRPAFRLVRPPSGVNFTALERRLGRTCLTLRSSPTISPSLGSPVLSAGAVAFPPWLPTERQESPAKFEAELRAARGTRESDGTAFNPVQETAP